MRRSGPPSRKRSPDQSRGRSIAKRSAKSLISRPPARTRYAHARVSPSTALCHGNVRRPPPRTVSGSSFGSHATDDAGAPSYESCHAPAAGGGGSGVLRRGVAAGWVGDGGNLIVPQPHEKSPARHDQKRQLRGDVPDSNELRLPVRAPRGGEVFSERRRNFGREFAPRRLVESAVDVERGERPREWPHGA